MPIYEYACHQCGYSFEHLHRSLSEKAPACPKCGAAKPQKTLSAFSPMKAAAKNLPSCAAGSCSASKCASGGCPYG